MNSGACPMDVLESRCWWWWWGDLRGQPFTRFCDLQREVHAYRLGRTGNQQRVPALYAVWCRVEVHVAVADRAATCWMASFHGPQILNLEIPLQNYLWLAKSTSTLFTRSCRHECAIWCRSKVCNTIWSTYRASQHFFQFTHIYASNRSLLCAQDEEILHSVKDVLDVINQTTAQAERGDHRLNLGVVLTLTWLKSYYCSMVTREQLTQTTKRLIWITDASHTTNFSNAFCEWIIEIF